ncbi:unnamed protein product [Rotaria sordida]|uniref:ADP-ribosylglycohydrolase n=1 Tax=Rotaria sordida TaxID=392033 RepID=A0A814FIY6_9BILA|nr:unnamed protein product [Rotaria sordida]CAF1048455.1 unnamed protein product [Rotaria sordida]
MRLAPVPLFFYRNPEKAVQYSGDSARITHGDDKAYDACRYYGALIVAALHGTSKDKLTSNRFYENNERWFGNKPLHADILNIAQGSYKKSGGYDEGIRGKGYVASALEAALWAFWSDNNSFEEGVLNAVNLGDDTDTTAAIYGQLAGAFYGYQNLPNKWLKRVYAKSFINHIKPPAKATVPGSDENIKTNCDSTDIRTCDVNALPNAGVKYSSSSIAFVFHVSLS